VRVTSSLWVGAFIRRSYGEGTPATVVRHGADEAGAIFIIVDRLSGAADLYGPAPQSSFEESLPDDRLFQKVLEGETSEAVSERLEREKRFDSDLWIVAVEDRDGRTFFQTVKA
jgi:hypothetical protein